MAWAADTFGVCEAAVLQGWPSSSDESEEEEEEATFFFLFLGPVFFLSQEPAVLAAGSGAALVEGLAVGALPGGARETGALAAFAEDRGRLSSSSDSSEEEEEEEGGSATRCFSLDSLAGVEVSGPHAGLLPRLEGG